MTDQSTTITFLSDPKWDDSARWVVMWQFGMLGHFQTALANLISIADGHNLDKIEQGFPYQVRGYRQWAYGDLADRLRRAGLDI